MCTAVYIGLNWDKYKYQKFTSFKITEGTLH